MNRSIRCSQCGIFGHNKRNLNCPVNISIREQDAEYQRELTSSTADFNSAYDLLYETSQLLRNTDSPACDVHLPFIEYEDEDSNATLNTDLVDVIHKTIVNIDSVCYLLTNARIHCNIILLMDALKAHVSVLNSLISERLRMNPFVLADERDYAKVWLYKVDIQFKVYGIVAVYQSCLSYHNITLLQNSVSSLRNILLTRRNIERLITPIIHIASDSDSTVTVNLLKRLSIVHESLLDGGEETEACPICFDDTTKGKLLRTNCSHGFCLDCMSNYTNSIKMKSCNPTCPYCRTVIVEVKSGDRDICRQFSQHIVSM